jgi:hypothetical protein
MTFSDLRTEIKFATLSPRPGLVPRHAASDVGADRGDLLGVAAVVSAVEGEVADGGELGFNPVQLGARWR